MPSVEDSYTALGPNELGFHASRLDEDRQQAFRIGGHMTGARFGLLAFAGNFASNQGPNEQNNYSLHAGVEGASKDFTGVVGASFNRPGVYGQVEDHPPVPDGLLAGVLGAARTQQGVIGFSRAGDGLEGASFTGNAVRATSFFGSGVHSISGTLSGVIGISGTAGPQVPNTANIAGVFGTSSNQPGVIGTSNAVIGVFGFSDNVGVVGQTTNPNSFAGFFSGNVVVNGTLTANVKNAVVTFPDRTQRVLHCMESPEHWFEDFGTAKLARGRGTVELDGDFAKVIKPADYHVFVTPEGDCRGLYVAEKKTASFEVRELGGGTSSVAFSYRIVGRRRDITRHRRFAKVDTRLPLPSAATRAPRRGKADDAALRTFIAGLEKQARERAPKQSRKVGKPRRARRRSAGAEKSGRGPRK